MKWQILRASLKCSSKLVLTFHAAITVAKGDPEKLDSALNAAQSQFSSV